MVEKFLYSLGLIALGLILGQIIRKLMNSDILKDQILVEKYIKNIQNTALLVLNPFISMSAFWAVSINNVKFIFLPFLGIVSLIIGGILGIVMAKVLKMDNKQTGAMFVSASFTNLGSFGGLICFVFFGEISYAFVSMYRLFEELFYYTVGFPIAKLYGNRNTEEKRRSILRLLLDKYIIVSLISIIIGSTLNFTGLPRPQIFKLINEFLIPVSSLMLVTTVGYRMRFTVVGKYIKECLSVSSIKFFIVPLVITGIAYIMGFGEMENGLVLKVILILSSMPPAFNSLIPPQLYDLDRDLTNSCWLFNTGALVIVLPVLFLIQRVML